MKRKIKFPLIMNKETSVRTIEELRNNFNIEEVIEYFLSGKLEIWLRDRNYNSQLEKILKLDINKKSFNIDLCVALDVDFKDYIHINAKEIEEKNKRLKEIKKYTDKKSILDKVDEIIFKQEELTKRLNDLSKNNISYESRLSNIAPLGTIGMILDIALNLTNKAYKSTKIYLCGDEFSITDNFENVTYIGINKPIINLISSDTFDAKSKNISFENLIVTSKNKIDLKIKDYELFKIDENKINLKNCEGRYCKTYIHDIYNNKYIIDNNGDLHKFSEYRNKEELIFTPEFESKIVDIDSDQSSLKFIAVDENGKVYQWGDWSYLCKSVPSDLPKIIQVTADQNIFIALDESGKLHWWGGFQSEHIFEGNSNYDGSKIYYKKMPSINSKIIQVTCRYGVVMAVDENGEVYSWGRNYEDEQKLHNIPKNLPPIKKVALYRNFVFALDKYGKIHFWGEKDYGNYDIPVDLPKIADITDCNGFAYSALDESGKIYIWGKDSYKYKDDVEKLPSLTCLVDIGGIDENGKCYGIYMEEDMTYCVGEITESIKSMIPIR